jgi:hypothetical protein
VHNKAPVLRRNIEIAQNLFADLIFCTKTPALPSNVLIEFILYIFLKILPA